METDPGVVADLLVAPDTAGKMALFLGAGCSKSSGVPLAREILTDAQRELFTAHTRRPTASDEEVERWIEEQGLFPNPASAYGDALETLRPTPRGRRIWLSRYFEDRTPAAAYYGLAELVRSETLTTLCTTNFDDLPERAMRDIGTTLRVVANDQAAGEIELPAAVATLLKLHGDYLFDRIANTAAEVADLPAAQKRNLELILSLGGIIVVGYGGADESIMSVFESVADVPLGLYWLHVGTDPPERVQKLVDTRPWAHAVQIVGFDEWMANVVRLHELRAGAQRRSGVRLRPPGGPVDFVAHDRLRAVRDRVRDRILGEDLVTVVSGRPGQGKTTLAKVVAESQEIEHRFPHRIYISAENRAFGLAELMDALWLELEGRSTPPDAEHARAAVLAALDRQPLFIVLDNLESLDDEVIALLREIPITTRVLATVRSAERLRGLGIPFGEIEHPGLDDSEMGELAELLADRSPLLRQRLDTLAAGELDQSIAQLRGWPQALKLLLAQLADPATPGTLADQLASSDVYDVLLSGAVSALPSNARRFLRGGAAFPATFTLVGAKTVACISEANAREALRLLVARQLVVEAAHGVFVFAHPLIADYARQLGRNREAARMRARAYLTKMIDENGGQPAPDWSNFAALDTEFENVRELIDHALDAENLAELTTMISRLFPYIVERGHWLYTDTLCERVLRGRLAPTWAAEWWVWRSWIALYLRQNARLSAEYALEALATGTRRRWSRFQAHRRAIVAFAELGAWNEVESHRRQAEAIARTFRRNATAQVDLLNTVGRALRKQGEAEGNQALLEDSAAVFAEAEARNNARPLPNTRELNVSQLGRAQVLWALGQSREALPMAQDAAKGAWNLRWLRGIVEANELVAELADAEGREDLATSARNIASSMSTQLRGAA